MDSQVSYAYSLSSITLFLHRGQYSSIPAARHLSWTRHSFFRHPGHSAQFPFIRAFSSLCSIFPSLFEWWFTFGLCALYSAIALPQGRPRFSGWGRVLPQIRRIGETPSTAPQAANSPDAQAAGGILYKLHKHTVKQPESMPQLNKITILLTLQNPETIEKQGFLEYAYYPVPKFA